MEPLPNQSTTTPPPPADVQHVVLHVLLAASCSTTEPPPDNADHNNSEEEEADASLPLGVKLTGYRLLNLVVILVIGFAKFLLSLKGQTIALTGLEWFGGSVFAALSYWVGLYELDQSPRWGWFLHVDLAPGIGFASKCFLRGFLSMFAIHWEVLPVMVFTVVILAVPIHVLVDPCTTYINIIQFGSSFFAVSLGFILATIFPKKWRVWKRVWVWARFFRNYGSDNPTRRGRYRDVGAVAYFLGSLSEIVLMCLLPYGAAIFVEGHHLFKHPNLRTWCISFGTTLWSGTVGAMVGFFSGYASA